jgi:CRP-like cAMP-binding protein
MQKTEMFDVLFATVSHLIDIPDIDKSLCIQYFEPVFFSKNIIIEKAGRAPAHQYFVVKGIMRNFYIDDSGEEITTDMNNGPRFFTSYNYFVNRTISNENIECITECSLLRIKRDDVDILYKKSTILNKYTILLLEKVFEEERARIKELTTLTAKQRYLKFVESNPNIIKNAPLQYIASYLGIKPETISRIRKNLIS